MAKRYAIRSTAHSSHLIEVATKKEEQELEAAGYLLRFITASEAHDIVRRDSMVHETGLYIDAGKVRYAKADPYGY